MKWLRKKEWSPYIAGAFVGLLNWFAILTVKPLGASTTFARTAAMIETVFAPGHVADLPYFERYGPTIDWQWMLVLGILMGAFVSSRLSGQFQRRFVPPMWAERYGNGNFKRWIVAFIGGILLMGGARMAGGCPSGHGLSGVAQLAVSGWIAVMCFFTGGILTARLLYGKGGK
jgi:uncharacterized membrane protein YedE/YeeE